MNHPHNQQQIRLARQLVQQGRLDDARHLYEQICSSDQEYIEPLLELAVINRRTGNYQKAAANCKKALEIEPTSALANHLYGSILQATGNIDAAISCYHAALKLDPTLAESHFFLGNAWQACGQLDTAADSYNEALKLQPEYLEAMGNLGATLIALHLYADAQTILEKANRLFPGHAQILCSLGDLYMLQDKLDKAIEFAISALSIDPGFFDAHYLCGRIYRHGRDYDRAIDKFMEAHRLRPGNEDVIGSLSELLEIRREYKNAMELIRPLIDKGTLNPHVLRTYSALARHFNNEAQAITLLELALAQGRIDISQQIKLHSELGKQYDHLQKYPQAFGHYRQANQLERELNKHIRQRLGRSFSDRETIVKWSGLYGKSFWTQLPLADSDCNRPVFIVGMPRSGTTLAEQILSSHPDVHGAGELPDIDNLARRAGDMEAGEKRFGFLENIGKNDLSAAASSYLETLKKHSKHAARVVDKMPTNFWHLGYISRLFPGASIIHMQRDPRDVCLSMYFQRFSSSMPYTSDLLELAEYYNSYAAIMDYWKEVLNIKIIDIAYEQLVQDPKNMIRAMVSHCGLEWNEQCMAFYETARDVHTPSYDQVRQPMYNKSVGRWKRYAEQLTSLTCALGLEQ